MTFGVIRRLNRKKSKWIIGNLMETDKIHCGWNSLKQSKYDYKLMARRRYEEIMKFSTSAKFRRDSFGATILPSNLSFDNMKKLSMNQIKQEEIPIVDENEVAEAMIAEKKSKIKESEEWKESSDKKNERDIDISESEINKEKLEIIMKLQRTDPFEDIPGPRIFESIMSIVKYTTRHLTGFFLLRFLQNGWMTLFRKYGPIVRLPEITGGKILIVNRSEHIIEIHEQDRRHPASSSLDTLECSRLRRHGKPKNCTNISEFDWEKTIQSINKILKRDEEKYFDGLEECGNLLIKRIKLMKNKENEVKEDFIKEINKWSLQCLFHILFEKSIEFLDPQLIKSKNSQLLIALQEATRCLNICENGFQFWRHIPTKASISLDNYCQSIETILSQYVYQSQEDLLNKNDEDSLTITERMLKDGLTKTEVVTNLLDIMLIGMNSISNTLIFLLYHLAKNPGSQTEVLKEIKGILPEKYSRLEYDHIQSMNYLKACLKETLRLKMPIPILTRYLTRNVIVSNFQIPRGTFVVMAAQADALKEENFERSKEFHPNRWRKSENKYSDPIILLSGYSQNSIETRLAEISIMICMAQIIRNFRIEYNYGKLTAMSSPLSCPTKPLKFSFQEREG